MRPSSHVILAWVVVALYASLIFALSALSHPPVPGWDLPHLDKVYHSIAYALLAFLLIRALRKTWLTHPGAQLIYWGVALSVVYGLTDELHQAFTPGRVMSVYDLMADAVGASVVGLIWPSMQRRWPTIITEVGSHTSADTRG
ncbi:MAG: VanZ family protein [Nitrospinae bacterium]|nr:VanZ family protein [Nitrospinota bacterium]